MEQYKKLEIEVIPFAVEDVIRASATDQNYEEGDAIHDPMGGLVDM